MNRTIFGFVVLAALLAAGVAMAQDAAKIDPLADQVLRAASDYLAEVERFSFHGEVFQDDWAETGAPGRLDDFLGELDTRWGIVLPLSDFAFSNFYDAMMPGVVSGTYVGVRVVDGTEYHHLAFSEEVIDWQIWIADGIRPLPGKLTITYKTEEGHPRFTALIDEWDLGTPIPEVLFAHEAPPGAQRIEFLPISRD